MADIVQSARARADLLRIWLYVAEDSESAADRLLEVIEEKIMRLAVFPEMGSPRDDIRPDIRSLVHGRYLVFYRYDPIDDRVRVLTIVEGERDLSDLF